MAFRRCTQALGFESASAVALYALADALKVVVFASPSTARVYAVDYASNECTLVFDTHALGIQNISRAIPLPQWKCVLCLDSYGRAHCVGISDEGRLFVETAPVHMNEKNILSVAHTHANLYLGLKRRIVAVSRSERGSFVPREIYDVAGFESRSGKSIRSLCVFNDESLVVGMSSEYHMCEVGGGGALKSTNTISTGVKRRSKQIPLCCTLNPATPLVCVDEDVLDATTGKVVCSFGEGNMVEELFCYGTYYIGYTIDNQLIIKTTSGSVQTEKFSKKTPISFVAHRATAFVFADGALWRLCSLEDTLEFLFLRCVPFFDQFTAIGSEICEKYPNRKSVVECDFDREVLLYDIAVLGKSVVSGEEVPFYDLSRAGDGAAAGFFERWLSRNPVPLHDRAIRDALVVSTDERTANTAYRLCCELRAIPPPTAEFLKHVNVHEEDGNIHMKLLVLNAKREFERAARLCVSGQTFDVLNAVELCGSLSDEELKLELLVQACLHTRDPKLLLEANVEVDVACRELAGAIDLRFEYLQAVHACGVGSTSSARMHVIDAETLSASINEFIFASPSLKAQSLLGESLRDSTRAYLIGRLGRHAEALELLDAHAQRLAYCDAAVASASVEDGGGCFDAYFKVLVDMKDVDTAFQLLHTRGTHIHALEILPSLGDRTPWAYLRECFVNAQQDMLVLELEMLKQTNAEWLTKITQVKSESARVESGSRCAECDCELKPRVETLCGRRHVRTEHIEMLHYACSS